MKLFDMHAEYVIYHFLCTFFFCIIGIFYFTSGLQNQQSDICHFKSRLAPLPQLWMPSSVFIFSNMMYVDPAQTKGLRFSIQINIIFQQFDQIQKSI
ncbi:hypothetical protein pb186bvf_007865 [Paramecium bursaria]